MTNAVERQRIVADFEQSGLSRHEYCEQYRLSVNTLDNWRRKVKEAGERKLVRVEVSAAPMAHHSRFALVLANGRRIEIEAGFDERELTRLLRAVEA